MAKSLALLLLLSLLFPRSAPAAGALPPGAAGIASVVPGLGQALSGETGEGLAWFVTVVGGIALSPRGKAWPATAFWDLWMYNVYDAYRHAGAQHTAHYTLLENYIAAYNPVNLIDPVGAPVIAYNFVGGKSGPAIASSKGMAPLEMSFVALGEESLFRGFFFSGFTDLSGSPVVGGVLSSLLFAYSHKFYDGQSKYALQGRVFAERTVFGLLMCLQTYMHHYDFRHSIFAHTWFDVVYEYRRAGGTAGGSAKDEGQFPRPSGFVYKYVLNF